MPLTENALLELLQKATNALDEEAIDLVDIDTDSYGRHKPVVSARDQQYFTAVTETAQAIRDLVEMVNARREGTP